MTIDRYHLNTFDKATFGGHQYSDKAIGTSLLGLPWWWLADRFFNFGEYGDVRTDFPLWVATTGAVSLPSAILVVLLYWVAREVTGDRRRAMLLLLSYGFGTIAFPFATIFFGHGPAAALGFGAFAAAFWCRRQGGALVWPLLLAGLLAGLAVLTEYPAAIVALLVWAYVVSNEAGRRQWWAYPAGVLAGILPLAAYNWAAFGSPWQIGYGFVADPSFSGMAGGLMGVTWPRLDALQMITFGEAGLFVRSPFLLLAVPGFWLWWRGGRNRREAVLCAGVGLGFLLYNAGYYLPMGGHTAGPRFLIPGLPFFALGLAGLPRRAWWIGGPLALASALLMLMITASLPKNPAGPVDTMLLYWWEHFRSGQMVPTWGNLNFGLQGRDALAPLGGLALAGLFLLALRKWGHAGRFGRTWGDLALAGVVYYVVAFPGGQVPALFAPPPLDQPQPYRKGQGPAGALSIRYGEAIELLGYRLERDQTHPGGRVGLTLYWRADRPVTEDYTVFIHVLDKDASPLGGWDTVPGAGAYPTTMWTPGRIVAETYWVPVNRVIDAPTAGRVEVGLYRFSTGERLAAVSGPGEKPGDSPLVARVPIRGKEPRWQAATPAGADLGGQVELLGYRLDDADPDRLRGRLYWRAGPQRIPLDYTVFVQALQDGKVVAQWDNQPREGGYPTSLWAPDEVVEDWFALSLPAQARQGITLVAGMYDLETMERLPVGESNFVELARPTP